MLSARTISTKVVLIGAAWTLPAGILIGLSPKWSQRLQPLVQVVASFPAPMVFPLVTILLVILHIPFTIGCVALMLLGAQWYVLFNVIAGAMAIPSELKEVGRVYGTPIIKRWTRTYIPGVFPYLVYRAGHGRGRSLGMRTIVSGVCAGQAAIILSSRFGLGSIIGEATSSGNFPLLAAGIVTMAVSVVMLNRMLWKRLYRMAENRYSLNV